VPADEEISNSQIEEDCEFQHREGEFRLKSPSPYATVRPGVAIPQRVGLFVAEGALP